MPDLIQTYQQYRKRGFEVIAVAMRYDQPGDIRAYVRKQGLPSCRVRQGQQPRARVRPDQRDADDVPHRRVGQTDL